MHAFTVLSAYVRAIYTLIVELITGSLPLDRMRLSLRTKGVDRSLLHSQKGLGLKAFVDGSVLESGGCGFGIFYTDGHYLNHSGSIDAGGSKPNSNLAELAAVYMCLLRHPRGQSLSIFSDSAFALRVVQHASEVADANSGSSAAARKRRKKDGDVAAACPRMEPREQAVAECIWWLLRMRSAATVFYKVPAHKGFTQNKLADALARHAAEAGGAAENVPLHSLSLLSLAMLLLRYLLGQSELDGGLMDAVSYVSPADSAAAAAAARRRALIPRPKPTGSSTEMTHILALDCEMVGIGAFGHESRLASVSVVNEFGNQVYFSYAKPPRPVTDYRTKYSGVEPKHLADAPPAAQVRGAGLRIMQRAVIKCAEKACNTLCLGSS